MPITSISRDLPNNVSIVRITCTDTLAEIATANYITNQTPVINELNKGVWRWFNSDVLLFDSSDGNAFFVFTDDTFSSLILLASSTDGTVSPGLMDQIAYYALSGTVVSGTNTLPNAVQINPNNANFGAGATANKFWAGNNTWKTVSEVTSHSIYSVYVSPDGHDVTGNGSINAPYKTVSKAYSTITIATPTDQVNIVILGGNISDTNISLLPNVNIIGNNSIITVSGNVTIDPTWDNGASVANYSGFVIDCPNPVNLNLDLSATLHSHKLTFDQFNVTNSDQLIITGKGSEAIIVQDITALQTGMLNLDLQIINSAFVLSNATLGNFSATLNPLTVPTTQSFILNVLSPTISITCNDPTATMGVVGISGFETALTVTGTGAIFFYDTSYDNVTAVGGALLVRMAHTDEITCDHTAVNYTPSPNDSVLTSHIAGIDNALGAITAVESQTRYVSVLGSDSGNGSIEQPYQTVAFAVASITTASSTNIFNVMLLDGVYTEAVQIQLKPWVNLVGQNRNTTINNASDIILDSTTWNAATNGTISIENLNIQNDLSLDFSTLTADGPIVYINNIQTDNFLIDGNTVNPCVFFIRNSFFINPSFNNSTVVSFSNYYFTGFNCGTTAFTAGMNYFSNNDYYQSSVSLTAANVGPTSQFNIKNSVLNFTLSVSGALATLYIDTDSYITPTLSGGAVMNLTSISGGLGADYIPVNYTPTATPPTLSTSVQGHLRGIDNALGALSAPAENYVYVSSTGSNITGNGTILDPFATVAHAMSTILTASSVNPFVIYLIGGTITETAQIVLKPFVSIVGASNSVILSLFTSSILDASWGSTANGTMRLSNFSWTNDDFIFDASAFVNATTSIIFVDNLFGVGRSINQKGSATHDIATYVNNSIISNVVYSNSFVNLMSCIISNVLCNPGLVDPALRTQTGHFLGCRLNNVDINGVLPFLTSGTFSGCKISTLSGSGAAVVLIVDTSSYVTPTLSAGATIDLDDPSASLSASDFTPTAYTPTATAPVLSTSLQGHLRGIDNAISSKTLVWSEVTGTSQAAAVNNAYITNNAGLVTVTLPATMALGDRVAINGKGAGGWSLVANAGQIINVGNTPTSVAGSVSSTNQWDAIEIVCVTANTTWATRSMIGTLTIV